MGTNSGFLNKGSNFINGAVGAVANRLSQAGLPVGGVFGRQQASLQSNVASPSASDDWRVRLTLPPNTYQELFGQSTILDKEIHGKQNGITWPVTPFINMSHSANYDSRAVLHNNFPYYAYQNSQVDQITISGSFPVTDQKSGLNWMGTLHFLRTITKMYYGNSDNQGNPPPVCRLNAYGDYVYKDVPVVVTNFNVELREAVDYIGVSVPTSSKENLPAAGTGAEGSPNQKFKQSQLGQVDPGFRRALAEQQADKVVDGNVNYVPTDSLIAVTCLPIYSRNKISNEFNLKAFAEGKIVKGSPGGLGGFI